MKVELTQGKEMYAIIEWSPGKTIKVIDQSGQAIIDRFEERLTDPEETAFDPRRTMIFSITKAEDEDQLMFALLEKKPMGVKIEWELPGQGWSKTDPDKVY